jgi:prefoldin subunit 5
LITINVHADVTVIMRDDAEKALLANMNQKLDELLAQGRVTMSALSELRTELETINATTNELADDVDALLVKVAEGTATQADVDAARAISAKLRGTADKFTPEVTPPPVEG